MKKLKVAFFDVDGTLIEHTRNMIKPRESTLQAFNALKGKGVLIVVASARTPISVSHATDYPFDGYISTNGSLIYALGKQIYTGGLNTDEIQFLWDYLSANHIHFLMLGEDVYVFSSQEEYEAWPHLQAIRKRSDSRRIIQTDRDVKELIHKVTVYYTSVEQRNKTHGDLSGKFNLLSYPLNVEHRKGLVLSGEISSLRDTKGKGIEHLLKYWDIKPTEAIAFGDNFNDIEMFELVDGYAMEEAVQELKDKAAEVIGPVDSDAIAQLLKRKGYID